MIVPSHVYRIVGVRAHRRVSCSGDLRDTLRLIKMTRLSQSCRRLTLAAGALSFTLSLPTGVLRAQGPGLFDLFAARKQSSSDPVFAGLGFGGYTGIFGLRVSGAMKFNGGNSNDG